MKVNSDRYVVAWVPPSGTRLAERGADWMGWCPESGQGTGGLDPVAARGLHAPLVAPFRLPRNVSSYMLHDVLSDLAFNLPSIGQVKFRVTAGSDGPMLISIVGGDRWRATAVHVATAIHELGGGMPLHTVSMQLDICDCPECAGATLSVAREHFAEALKHPVMVGDLALLSEPGDGRPWKVVDRFELCDGHQEIPHVPALECLGPRLMTPLAGVSAG